MYGAHLLRTMRDVQHHGPNNSIEKGSFANQLGKPDYIFVCMDTVSHPLVISAQKEAKKARRTAGQAAPRERINAGTGTNPRDRAGVKEHTMRIQKSAEDYLEMILRLHETKGYARAIDISYGLSVTKPSVSVAMRNLRENGYITVDKSRNIHLTDAGMAIAAKIYERHQLLTSLLVSIGVDAKIAEKDACRVEHDLSPETFEVIKARFSHSL